MSSVIHAANATMPRILPAVNPTCGINPKCSGPITIMDIRPHVTDRNADITPAILIVLVILSVQFFGTSQIFSVD